MGVSPWSLIGAAAAGLAVATAAAGPAPAQTAGDARAPPGVEVVVSGVNASVRQYETAVAYVTVRNSSPSPVTVTELEASPVKGLRICARHDPTVAVDPPVEDCPSKVLPSGLVLQPGDARLFRWDISIPDQVTAGKHPLVFEVTSTGPAGQRKASTASSIEAAVVGQTGALDVLKVSFLFLPGFLAVTAFYLLSAIGGQPEWIKRLAPNNPEAWAIGVLLSFGAIPLYPLLSGRSYLAGYAAKDFVLVWSGSVIFGSVLFGAYLVARLATRQKVAEYAGKRTPSPGDTPAALLEKLTRSRRLRGGVPAHHSLWFPQARLHYGGVILQVFRLADVPSQPPQVPMCWVAPPIQVDRNVTATEAFKRAVTEDKAVDVLAGSGVAARWASLGAIAGPELVPVTALVPELPLRPRLIVQEGPTE